MSEKQSTVKELQWNIDKYRQYFISKALLYIEQNKQSNIKYQIINKHLFISVKINKQP